MVNSAYRLPKASRFFVSGRRQKNGDKILHPKLRIEKLGVKPVVRVSLLGEFEPEFLREVTGLTKNVSRGKVAGDAECIFLAADSKADFAALPKIAKAMRGAATLWIVYPKGQKHITE